MAALEASVAGRGGEDRARAGPSLGRRSDLPRVDRDENTGQRIIQGMGELHLEVLGERLMREFGLKVRLGRPQVTYRETIRGAAQRRRTATSAATGGRDHYRRTWR